MGEKRTSGKDNFEVVVVSEDGKSEGTVSMVDNDNGTYEVHYTALLPGNYLISVRHLDLGEKGDWAHIRGSPFKVTCQDPWTHHRVMGQLPAVKKDTTLHFMAGDLVLCGAAEQSIHLCETQPQVHAPQCRPGNIE